MANKSVACLLGPMFEDSEYRIPMEAFKAKGYRVDVIGKKAGETVKGYRGQVTATIEKSIDDVSPQDYDLLFIPGGHSPDVLRADPRFVNFVRNFDQTGKPVAAVCHGPQLLAAAHLVKGRTLTAWQTVQDDLAQMGANVKDEAVVRDKNWITSRKPDDLRQFSDAAVQALGQ
ncbi:MAG: type 1 glutamine amidotransferase domain-containing protein [Sulfurifustis sp.]